MGRQMLAKTDGVGGMTTSSVATRHFRRWRLVCRLQLAVGRGSEATVVPLHSHTTSKWLGTCTVHHPTSYELNTLFASQANSFS
jgi:hypothetical protein